MAAKTVTEKQLIKLIDSIIPCVIERKDEFEIPSLKGIEGRLRRRVHTKTQDTKGKKRKYRSKLYAKKHKKKGAVNMRLTGNLSRDYGVYIDSNGDYSLGFLNKPQTVRTKKLGRYKKSGKRFKKKKVAVKAYTFLRPSTTKVEAEETRRGNPLYIPTKKEKNRMFALHAKFIAKTMEKCINKLSLTP